MISLADLARHCGVSVATVSKALNDQADVSAETKKRVRAAAEELGYFPNAAARSLKTNHTNNLGVLFVDEANSGLTHEYFSAVLEGFKKQAESEGYDITFINDRVGSRKMTYYEHCVYRNVDGVVIACVDFNNPEVIELMNSSVPVVTIDYIQNNCSSVLSDNIKGMNDLLEYVYSCGHRRIAFIHGQGNSFVTRTRVTAFYRFMQKHHLSVPEGYDREADYLDSKRAAEVTREMLQLEELPTCILYPDDLAVIGGINVIEELDYQIPEDISVCGYDGTKISQMLKPKLTTIKQDTEAIGRETAKKLIQTVENPKTTFIEQMVIPGSLIPGESVRRLK